MRKTKRAILISLFLVIAMFIAACSGSSTEPDQNDTAAEDFDLKADEKYSPPVEMMSVKSVDATVKFLGDNDIHNNIWTRTYADKLGINLKYLWVVDASQYSQKLSATVMSGELPDVFVVNSLLFKLLYDSEMIEDLTDVYEAYASEKTKEVMEQDATALPVVTLEGRMMGLPLTDASIAGAPLLWIRQDWMNKLGMAPPQSMQDVMEMAARFVKEDPDGNGLDDTFGLAMSKDLWSAYGGLQGFFNGFHAYPRIWIERDGSLVYGSVQPEYREALAALQEMYKRGEIDPEFGVKDAVKLSEDIANSRVGIEFGVWWNPYHPLNLSQANYPDAYWQAFPIPSIDDKTAKSQYSAAVYSMIVVRKGYPHPEAVMKMINLWTENFLQDDTDQKLRDAYLGDLDNPDVIKYKYTDFHLWEPNNMLTAHEKLSRALARRDPSGLNIDESQRYQIIAAYFDQGIKEAWVEVATNGENGAVSILNEIARDRGMLNRFYGAPTQTMSEKMAALHTMEEEMVIKVIMGEPLSEFDAFVNEWYSLGGEDITREVNDWWKENRN
jgi:putative aldouronate transport system substrate-binding protein